MLTVPRDVAENRAIIAEEWLAPHEVGGWIKLEDYAALDSENQRMREALAIALPWVQRCPSDGLDMQKKMILETMEGFFKIEKEMK